MSQEDERASANPLLLLDDEANGNKYMRAVGRKCLGEGSEMEWLIQDVHDELKSWGYPGGGNNALILKSGEEPAIVAVREAIARFHGGQISPEQSATGESQSNGRAEVSGRVIRGMVTVFKDQLEYVQDKDDHSFKWYNHAVACEVGSDDLQPLQGGS